jgi:hypothetical protein
MMTSIKSMDETRLAEEIVSVLEPSVVRECSDDRDVIRFAVRGDLKLRTVSFSRAALRRLLHDANGLVKVDYLKRDLLRTATQRSEFRYPRPSVVRVKKANIDAVLASRRVAF